MNTLQERLRANPLTLSSVLPLCREAADRIEADADELTRLRTEVADLRATLKQARVEP